MKKSGNLIIWVIALAMLFTAAYIYHSKNKSQVLQPPLNQNVNQQSSGQQNTTEWQTTSIGDGNTSNQANSVPGDNSQSGSGSQQASDKIMAPDFQLKDLEGNTVKLSDYRGKIVILNFWATWCKYCVEELPDFNELNRELEKDNDAVILAVDVQEKEETVRNFLTSKKIELKVLMDEKGEVAGTYGVTGYPNTFFINKDGSVYAYIPGKTDKATLNKILDKIRKGEPLK